LFIFFTKHHFLYIKYILQYINFSEKKEGLFI